MSPARRLSTISRRTFFNILFWVSSTMTSSASMIGIPARMKTANWRVKFMTSLRGTFFLVISKRQSFLFALDLEWLEPTGEQCDVGRARRRSPSRFPRLLALSRRAP